MGLLAAVAGSASGVFKDQWKEYFYCDSIPADILVVKGQKRNNGNNKGNDNVISNGSVIAVADGQCMLIVDQGKVVDLCAVPGEYVFDTSTESSLFDGGKLTGNIKEIFSQIGLRIGFGGVIPKECRVYYFNIKEIIGNKYGTPSPVPFRVVDAHAGIDIDIAIKCFGEYSYRIVNPMLFYSNICGNVSQSYGREELDSQLKSELLTALQPAFAKISEMGVRYSAIPGHTMELADALREVLASKWRETRGIEVVSIGVNSVKADEEDEKMLKDLQRTAAFTNPNMAAAYMVNATGNAMQTAAANTAGAMTGFMGMNMAQQAGGAMNPQALFAMGQQQAAAPAAQPAAGTWICPECGTENTGKFCGNCGAKKPESGSWICSECGTENTGKFCSNCGAKKPAGEWTCSCGTVNTGKFCSNCGSKRPE